jgi:hypothetical protein
MENRIFRLLNGNMEGLKQKKKIKKKKKAIHKFLVSTIQSMPAFFKSTAKTSHKKIIRRI